MNLQLIQVEFTYDSGVQALAGVNLAIAAGERVALIGANGAGKTTLAKQLNGLLRPSRGSIRVGDWVAAQHSVAELAHRVSYAFQNPADQLFGRTVYAEVAFGPRNLGVAEEQLEERVGEALQLVGLQGNREHHPYDLNPAERKLLSVAAAVAQGSPILVLDEPTSGQDRQGIDQIAAVLEAQARAGRTLIVISHDLDFCAKHLGRAILMAGGRILADGPMQQVLQDEASLVRSMLEPPQLIRLAKRLKMGSAPLSVPDFVDQYQRWRSDRS